MITRILLVTFSKLSFHHQLKEISFNKQKCTPAKLSIFYLYLLLILYISFLFYFQKTMNGPVYASSCPALQSNLSLHSSSYYSEYSGTTRRRLSSTGEADTSATSSYEGSDSSENSDESRLDPVSQMEREQLETFFRGLKSQVSFIYETRRTNVLIKN
jgi:hypothetical protein